MIVKAGETLAKDQLTREELLECASNIEQTLQIDRDNPGLVFLMGSVYLRAGRYALAEHWFRRCLDMHEMHEAWNNLGFLCQQEGRHDESNACFQKALDINPDSPELLNNIATGLINNGTPDEAIAACQKALEADPDAKDPRWNMALAQLEKGDWKNGFQGYRLGLDMTVNSTGKRKLRHYREEGEPPWWDGTPGKTVVVYGEQGVGDEIMGASMLPDLLSQNDVVLEAHPRLVNIFRHTWGSQIPIYGTRKANWRELAWPNWHQIDYKCPIIQLAEFFRREDSDFPRTAYLKPYDDKVEDYQRKLARLSDRPKIGISWKGGTPSTRSDLRNIPLQLWESFFKRWDVDWISLQYDPADAPGFTQPIVDSFNEHTGLNIHHWTDTVNDLDECYGGLIHALDLVISVNTSLVHACGAYGVDCRVLTPSKPAWRYGLTGPRMPFYGDHITQYRQEGDDWGSALDTLANDLDEFLRMRAAA